MADEGQRDDALGQAAHVHDLCAKLCGVSRQIVSGALRRLQLAGVVSLEYGGVRVPDVPALNRFAGVVYQ
ncbi:helix-turn-helix domain-containing protein [Variovorax sp. MHTC-1]|nr:helix-turn-helix domain-containing protein [Variovorax sp. MHTC-1]